LSFRSIQLGRPDTIHQMLDLGLLIHPRESEFFESLECSVLFVMGLDILFKIKATSFPIVEGILHFVFCLGLDVVRIQSS
jgi:hypothetical protein